MSARKPGHSLHFELLIDVLADDVIDDVISTKKYTHVARSQIPICTKFCVDKGATNIVNVTDKQTDRQTVKRTYLTKLKNLANNDHNNS